MTPKEFKGCNVVFAKDQPQYKLLPAQKSPDGSVLTEWEFSLEERIMILNGANLRLSQLTFNKTLQPILPFIEPGESIESKCKMNDCTPEQYILANTTAHGWIDARQMNRVIQISKLQHLSPEERLPYITTGTLPDMLEFELCECGHYAPLGFISYDEDSNSTCMNCVAEELDSRMKGLRDLKEDKYNTEDKIKMQPLFDLMTSHGLTLLQSEMQEIINVVNNMKDEN